MKLTFFVSFIVLLLLNDCIGSDLSVKKCEEYRKISLQTENEDGFLAKIVSKDGKISNGVLISENFVLASTALDTSDAYAAFGNETHDATEHYYVNQVHKPILENFVSSAETNIQLLQLNRTVKDVRPACLASKPIRQDEYMEIGWSGWSHTTSNTILRDVLKVLSNETCRTQLNKTNAHKYFCADSVKSDSESCKIPYGALFRKENGRVADEVVGLSITPIDGCAVGSHRVFVNIFTNLNWIEQTVWPDDVANYTTPRPTPTPRPNSGTMLGGLWSVLILLTVLSVFV
ncbi:hypothetical protein Bhyg_08565 [Pseudolycoriella hygida]|uniref:Peptidase S1 domain-containing protein n=1 Tax=Pseudolycoriella hygida TaxID=35572 RepID=A0A9Q0S338_9DIPT|nr:hypothetical protein Bhyg_08565 [Pseudolycoriella hygida]